MSPIWATLLFYVGLGLLLTAEEAGVFLLPGDISIVAAGVYAAQGGPFILLSWLVAASGMVLGASILFYSVRRHGASSRILPPKLRDRILRHGSWGVGAARLVPGLRNATVFAAAAASLPTQRFLMGLVPAAFLWSGILLAAGFFGGSTILATVGGLEGQPVLRLVSIALIVGAATYWLVRMRTLGSRDSATPKV